MANAPVVFGLKPFETGIAERLKNRTLLRQLREFSRLPLHHLRHGYRFAVTYAWYWYTVSSLFRRKIDQMVEAANTGFYFDYPDPKNDRIAQLLEWWSQNVNRDLARVANYPRGMTALNGQALLLAIMEGMNVWEWRIEEVSKERYPDFPLDGVYRLPMVVVLHSSRYVELRKSQWVERTVGGKKVRVVDWQQQGWDIEDPEIILLIIPEIDPLVVSGERGQLFSQLFVWNKSVVRPLDPNTSYAFKYSLIPGDLYPTPFVVGLFDTMEVLQTLSEMDRSTAEQLVRLVYYIVVGNENHEPVDDVIDEQGNVIQEGDLRKAKKLFENANWTNGFAIPYWMDIKKLETNDRQLLGADKYLWWFLRYLHEIGVTSAISPSDREGSQFAEWVQHRFMDLLEAFRQGGTSGGLKAFWDWFILEVILRDPINRKRLFEETKRPFQPPSFVWRELRVSGQQMRQFMYLLFMQGLVSGRTMLDLVGLRKETQQAQLAKEGHPFGEVRVSFRQVAGKAVDEESSRETG